MQQKVEMGSSRAFWLGSDAQSDFSRGLCSMTQLMHASQPGPLSPNILSSIYFRKRSCLQKHIHTHTFQVSISNAKWTEHKKRAYLGQKGWPVDNIFQTLSQNQHGISERTQILDNRTSWLKSSSATQLECNCGQVLNLWDENTNNIDLISLL